MNFIPYNPPGQVIIERHHQYLKEVHIKEKVEKYPLATTAKGIIDNHYFKFSKIIRAKQIPETFGIPTIKVLPKR